MRREVRSPPLSSRRRMAQTSHANPSSACRRVRCSRFSSPPLCGTELTLVRIHLQRDRSPPPLSSPRHDAPVCLRLHTRMRDRSACMRRRPLTRPCRAPSEAPRVEPDTARAGAPTTPPPCGLYQGDEFDASIDGPCVLPDGEVMGSAIWIRRNPGAPLTHAHLSTQTRRHLCDGHGSKQSLRKCQSRHVSDDELVTRISWR